MHISTDTFSSFLTFDDILNYDAGKVLFLDIETTGLSPATSFLYMIGILYRQEEEWHSMQWLADTPQEECLILERFLTFSAGYECFLVFNGQHFDLPYLHHKICQYHLPDEFSQKPCIDLYKRYRPLQKLLGLSHGTQVSYQQYLKIPRADTMSGKELIPVYQKYVSGYFPENREPLLLHNLEDLRGMTMLLPMAAFLGFLSGRFSVASCIFNNSAAELILRPDFPLPGRFEYHYEKKLNFILSALDSGDILLRIPALEGELKHFFPNYRDYCYLPLEDQAIHKSIAVYVDKEHRSPAKPSTCYVRKTAVFLPQTDETLTPSFREEFKSRISYFEYTEQFSSEPCLLKEYAVSLLQLLL